MNEWMFNDTPAQKQIGYCVSEQGRCVNVELREMNERMFNDTPARKQIGYWVSEQGRRMNVELREKTKKELLSSFTVTIC